MQKLCLVTCADDRYAHMQQALVSEAYKMDAFDRFFTYNTRDVDANFQMANRDILSRSRGAGYCLWKPYFIFRTLSELSEGDILLYMDAADGFIMPEANNIRNETLDIMADKDMCLTVGGFKHSDWTKRDCFYYMNCDTPQYHERIQLEAGVGVYKKTNRTLRFVSLWLQWCKDPRILTEDPNICGLQNLPGFKEHRYDQSVLTNLWIGNPDVYAGNDMRKFIKCNVRL